MGGYIGARAGTISATVANVQDVTATDTTPEVTIVNTTHEDTDGGREGKVIFKGQQSGGEESTLAEIQGSHDGTADDEKGDLIFRTNDGSDGASPTEAMRITSQQRVGILTNDPSHALDVTQTGATSARVGGTGGSGANDGTLIINNGGTGDAMLRFDYETNTDRARIGTSTSSQQLEFYTAGDNERMRIDSDGMVGIGNTVAGNMVGNSSLTIGTGASGQAGVYTVYSNSDTYGALYFADATSGNGRFAGGIDYNHSNDQLALTTSSTARLKINSNGNLFVPTMAVGGTANLHWSSSGGGQFFVTSSSRRFKHDIVDYDKGLAEVLQMQPKYFVYNDEPNQKQRAGFIAEDFHDIGMTEYVEYWQDENGEDIPSEIGYSNMVAVLVNAIQELSAKNDALETKVETLETQNTTQATQIADLITRVTALEAE